MRVLRDTPRSFLAGLGCHKLWEPLNLRCSGGGQVTNSIQVISPEGDLCLTVQEEPAVAQLDARRFFNAAFGTNLEIR